MPVKIQDPVNVSVQTYCEKLALQGRLELDALHCMNLNRRLVWPTLLKGSSQRCHRRTIFGSTKNHPVKLPSLSYLFYNLKNLLSPQRSFCETERFFRC